MRWLAMPQPGSASSHRPWEGLEGPLREHGLAPPARVVMHSPLQPSVWTLSGNPSPFKSASVIW